MKSFFTPREVAKIIGISYRQIQYWDKTGFIKPTYRRRGKYRLYTFADLLRLRIAIRMRKAHYSIQQLRKTLMRIHALLPQVGVALDKATILIGETIYVSEGLIIESAPDARDEKKPTHIMVSGSELRSDVEALFPDVSDAYITPERAVML